MIDRARLDRITCEADIKFERAYMNGKTFNPGDVVKCLLEGEVMGGLLRCEHYGIYVGRHRVTNNPLCVSKYKQGIVADRLDLHWEKPTKGDHNGTKENAKSAIKAYLSSQGEECYHLHASNCEEWVQKVLRIDVPTQRSTLIEDTTAGVVTFAAAATEGIVAVVYSGGVMNAIAKPLLAFGPIGWMINGLVLAGTIGYAIYAKNKKQ